MFSALYCVDGLIGVITHFRGVARKPAGFREPLFNIVMGPPLLAPGRWPSSAAWALPRLR